MNRAIGAVVLGLCGVGVSLGSVGILPVSNAFTGRTAERVLQVQPFSTDAEQLSRALTPFETTWGALPHEEEEQYELSVQQARDLGFSLPVVGGVSGRSGATTRVLVKSLVRYREVPLVLADGRKVTVRQGAGVRVLCTITSAESSTTLDFYSVAAQVQLNRAEATLKLYRYGLSTVSALDPILNFGAKLDLSAVVRIDEGWKGIRAVMKPETVVTAVPIAVGATDDLGSDAFEAYFARIFALRQIAAGRPLSDALRRIGGRASESARSEIARVYREFIQPNEGGPVTQEAMGRAKDLLERYGFLL